MKVSKKDMTLYAVTDRSWLGGRDLCEDIEKALKGGITFLQLREKNLGHDEFLKLAIKVKELASKYNVPFVINDNVQIAIESDADGVHIGMNDMAVSNARQLLGEDKIIGATARTLEQAIKAEQMGADYLGVGAVFGTTTKLDTTHLTKEACQSICRTVKIPVVGIGGIKGENIMQLEGYEIDGVAVVSGIFAQQDIEGACVALKKASNSIRRSE